MLLPVLRTPPRLWTACIAVFCVFVLSASSISAKAETARAHRASQSSHHRTPARSLRRSAGHSYARNARYTPARLGTVRHRPAVVRARMPIRHYSWMNSHSAGVRTPMERELARTDVGSGTNASHGAKPGVPAPATSVAEAEVSDSGDANTATAQDAANQIAAAEVSNAHPALVASVVPAPDPFHSTRIVAMAPLRGSLESLIRQNEKTNADNLERIEDDTDLENRIASGQLVRVPESGGLTVNPSLPVDRRYCRPWTASFLNDLSRAHQAQFHRSFEVSSAVRTVAYQKHLMRTNGNAAPAQGDIASPHLTGATIDIAKRGLTRSELYWMRDRLNSLQAQGKIDVEEEFRQSCFHITVYKSYIGAGPAHPHPPSPPSDGADGTVVVDPPAPGI